MGKRFLASVFFIIFLSYGVSAEDILLDKSVSSPSLNLSKPEVSSTKKSDKLSVDEILEMQKQADIEDIEMLWSSVTENNTLIKFAVKKLSVPESQRRIHSSLLSRSLSSLISGACFVPMIFGAEPLAQSASFATGRIAQNYINKNTMPATEPLTDTELIELAGLVEELQLSLINTYYNYKASLIRLKEINQDLILYNKNKSEAISKKNKVEILLSSNLYSEKILEKYQVEQDAKRYNIELVRLAGANAVKNIKLQQFDYNGVVD